MKAINEKIDKFIGQSDSVFIIPPFQRNYAWDEEQCCELFDDVIESMKKNKNHYIGNVVYYLGENNRAGFHEYILVDGQQRITTILLLLCAIKTKLSDLEAKRLEKKYLKNIDEEDEKYRIKLKQTDNDMIIFEKIINEKRFTEDDLKNRLVKNYEYFIERIEEFTEEEASNFFNAIINLDIVDLNLQIENDLEAVQKIFEKINSTGKPLSVADLIRNYLLISNNSVTQKKLYEDYWLRIENLYENKENISDFAKHYLITKRFAWVEEKKLYNTSKLFFNNSEISKEEILKEILYYSQFYNWFIDEKCPIDKLNIIIKQLNVLKSDDMYSLLFVLFDKLYYDHTSDLIKILDLLCDFMIRYRLVSPSNGSSDIRKTFFTLLGKIVREDIDLNYDNVLFELSNSPSPGGRFPNNHEFENKLKGEVNVIYAKALLYKLEYKVKKNIEVDIKKVTVEHLMPQKLSDEWKEYLGGEEDASLIHNTYLNNIGNLALLSRSLNSENSNAIWDKKINNIINSQFVLTNQIEKDTKWNQHAILKRCKTIQELAIKYITSPLERKREFETMDSAEETKSGIYDINDSSLDVTGKTIKCVIYNNQIYSIECWNELLPLILKLLNKLKPNKINDIIKSNVICKSTTSKNYYFGNDPIISKEDKYLVRPFYVEELECYVEKTASASRALYFTSKLIEEYDLKNEFKLEIE